MKKLYIIRHAKSSWDDPEVADFDRPLNKRGMRDAPNMGKRLKEKRVVPDFMITSPANRALTTCKIIADMLGYPHQKIKTERALYHADEDEILWVIKLLSDKHDTILLFGHNPGLTDFINRLLDESILNIPTCGVVSCTLPVESWEEADWGKGELEFFDFPKKK